MMGIIRKLSKKKLYPFLWTLLTIGLLCLPGSAIPTGGLFSIKHLDKIAHIILFGGIVMLWGFYFFQSKKFASKWALLIILITAGNIILGIIMEYIQRDFIPNRSFDIGDIWADAAGSVLVMSYLILWRNAVSKKAGKPAIYKKSKPL